MGVAAAAAAAVVVVAAKGRILFSTRIKLASRRINSTNARMDGEAAFKLGPAKRPRRQGQEGRAGASLQGAAARSDTADPLIAYHTVHHPDRLECLKLP